MSFLFLTLKGRENLYPRVLLPFLRSSKCSHKLDGILGTPLLSQELDSIILVGPFQIKIFYDSKSISRQKIRLISVTLKYQKARELPLE